MKKHKNPLDKKLKAAGKVKDKILEILMYFKDSNTICINCEDFKDLLAVYEYLDKVSKIDILKYYKGKYFTNKEKDIIIHYLIECLTLERIFDVSSLGPNIYLNDIENTK